MTLRLASRIEDHDHVVSRHKARALAARLTRRQRQVLLGIAGGLSPQQIASTLKISRATVSFHRTAMERVVRVFGPANLTRFALRSGLCDL